MSSYYVVVSYTKAYKKQLFITRNVLKMSSGLIKLTAEKHKMENVNQSKESKLYVFQIKY